MKTQAVLQQQTASADKVLMVKTAVCAAFSFLLCRSQLLGSMAPFGVSFAVSMPFRLSWIMALGSSLGYVSLGLQENHLIYLASLALAMAQKLIIHKLKPLQKWETHPAVCSLSVLLAFLLSNGLANVALQFSASNWGLQICESMLACGVTAFCSFASNAFFSIHDLRKYNSVELSSTIILFLLGIIALMSFQPLGFSFGIIAASASVLIAAEKFGAVGASACGVILAIGINLYSTEYLSICSILVAAAFFAGMFRPVGRVTQAAVFLSISLFGAFIVGMSLSMLFLQMDILLGCGVYFLIPKRWLSVFDFVQIQSQSDQSMKDNIGARLDFAAQTIADLQHSIEQVSQKLNSMDTDPVETVCQRTVNYVCRNCGLNLFCWDEQYNTTADQFSHMLEHLKQHKTIVPEQIDEFGLLCCKKNLLCQKMNQYYQEYDAAQTAKLRISEVRNLAVEQLSGVSQMLWEVSDELTDMQQNDPALAHTASEIFTALAVPPNHVFCTINRFGRLEIDFYTLTGTQFDPVELQQALSHGMKRDLAEPSISTVNNKVRISFYEKANFTTEYSVCQVPSTTTQSLPSKQARKICGDSYEYFPDNRGNAYFILSDGMGCGKRAALDSTMTCSMVLKLIKAGFGMDSVIKFVNSSLQAKSTDESLSTIDLLKIDLYTGQAEFYKAGSAASLVKVDNVVSEIKSNSLPVGILHGVEFDKQTLTLHPGDRIVMFSDGVPASGERVIRQTFQRYSSLPSQELADKLCEAALLASGDEPHDDLTVFAIEVKDGISS
ncbi:MAG: SpoIIE family protein phosphatase [Massiliimalia sp.]|jgi:stage II sporulation protein E